MDVVDHLASRFSVRMRQRRHRRLIDFMMPLSRPVRILDIGGTNGFWESLGIAGDQDYEIVLVNNVAEAAVHKNLRPLVADATNLAQFGPDEFDLVFSNSVIEHLFTYENQQAMAAHVQRLSTTYWVQTPNFWFPVEPHFLFLGWHWLPRSMRIWLLQKRRWGRRQKQPDHLSAAKSVDEVRLLRRREMADLFPAADLIPEKFVGVTKSWIAVNRAE